MSNFKPNYFQRRSKPQGPKANERIRALDVQVIGSDGSNLGTMPLNKAIELAKQESLDLETKKNTPIFLYHGEDDQMIDVHSAKLSYGMLDKYGIKYSLKTEKELGHSISIDEIGLIGKFMKDNCE